MCASEAGLGGYRSWNGLGATLGSLPQQFAFRTSAASLLVPVTWRASGRRRRSPCIFPNGLCAWGSEPGLHACGWHSCLWPGLHARRRLALMRWAITLGRHMAQLRVGPLGCNVHGAWQFMNMQGGSVQDHTGVAQGRGWIIALWSTALHQAPVSALFSSCLGVYIILRRLAFDRLCRVPCMCIWRNASLVVFHVFCFASLLG